MNCRNRGGFKPGWQKHHLLPRQLQKLKNLRPFWMVMKAQGVGFEDFTTNGVLLPGTESHAAEQKLPLHRGPHRHYTDVVAERVAVIEKNWSQRRPACVLQADRDAAERLFLLQLALRRRLCSAAGPPVTLNRKDPVAQGVDFSTLDAMADALWSAV
ncbi:AHH domain-containing protein [Croceicoccus sp. F390]|uniref:AHH domain-containing protein n=1 Tax=Croceicoccus esteveae TaxID=3075597 RepID=A0ABU2ZEQ7_9SPHN|nr:AHH domain-containing protein [Croceicoccus sp. F390]MDT0575075.1 AHH domain-containing protein [Croceicoccus sp. F390]